MEALNAVAALGAGLVCLWCISTGDAEMAALNACAATANLAVFVRVVGERFLNV